MDFAPGAHGRALRASIIALLAMGAAGAENATSPLPDAPSAFSLEVGGDGSPSPRHFPLGILGHTRSPAVVRLGGSFRIASHQCLDFRDGKPCRFRPEDPPSGELVFASCWSAHTLSSARASRDFGELRWSRDDQGKEHGGSWASIFHPATRDYVLAADRHNAQVQAVDGRRILVWNIDNEWESPLDYSDEARTAFRQRLESAYGGDLARLNGEWGSRFPSFAAVEPPDRNGYRDQPAAWLAWRRFQEEAYADFIAQRFAAIQAADPLHRPVLSKSTQCTIEMTAVAKKLANNHELLAERTRPSSGGWYGIDIYGHTDRNCYELSYLHHCAMAGDDDAAARAARLFCCEINNHSGPGWQFGQSFWRVLAHGAKAINVFTLGFRGANGDWATFGLTDPLDGSRRDRFFYAARLFAAIRRSEAFWSGSVTAAVPRLALVMPQRDVQLAETGGASRWDYPKDNRLNVYGHLRNAGYWVDVIPTGKLRDGFLSRYQGLVLVGSEHLSGEEAGAIRRFVSAGGVLIGDMRPGYFDERHQVVHGLDEVLGVELGAVDAGIDLSPDDLWYYTATGDVIRTDGKIRAKLSGARIIHPARPGGGDKYAWVCLNRYGRGAAVWFNTRLGLLRPESGDASLVSDWLATVWRQAGLAPAYQVQGAAAARLRVEAPQIDPQGNVAVIVANHQKEAAPASRITLALPPGAYASAFLALAEETGLRQLPPPVAQEDGRYRIDLPELATAAIVYLFRDHPVLLGIAVQGSGASHPADPSTVLAAPGETFTASVQIANPGQVAARGALVLRMGAGWRIEAIDEGGAEVPPGGMAQRRFRITAPRDDGDLLPEMPYPLTARWSQDGREQALALAHVLVRPDPARHAWLLTGNRGSRERDSGPYAFALPPAASYIYRGAEASRIADPHPAKRNREQDGRALFNGLGEQARFPRDTPVEIVIDLAAVRQLASLRLARSAWAVPEAASVALSLDGSVFGGETALDLRWQPDGAGAALWSTTALPGSARYLRLSLRFPAGKDAFLDEVEVWGRP